MKLYGYITLKEASEISGIAIETLKKQCQSGRIRGAVKEAGSWFVPRDEILIKPIDGGGLKDDALILMVIFAEAANTGVNVTLYTNGLVIEGLLISTNKYIEHMKKHTNVSLGFEDTEMQQMINSSLEVYYDKILKKNDNESFKYVHLEQVLVKQAGGDYEPQGALLRLKIDSVDGFQLGTTKKFKI